MPKKGGVEVARELQDRYSRIVEQKPLVYFLSADDISENIHELEGVDFEDYFIKLTLDG